jgi:phage terminase Nu1 subunit (DNA packaging protein)
MLQAGDLAEDRSDLDVSVAQSRLAKAVSDIAKLANAMEALAAVNTRESETSRDERMPEIGGYRSDNQHRQEAS